MSGSRLYDAPVAYMSACTLVGRAYSLSCINRIMLFPVASIKMLCLHVQITQKTNHFGLFLLALLLADKLKESAPSRMVWVASPAETFSGNIDWDDLKCVPCMAACCPAELSRTGTGRSSWAL